MDTLSTRLKKARKDKKLTQEGLGRLVGVTKSSVSQWESGQTKMNGENIVMVSKALDVSPYWLSTGKKEEVELQKMSLTNPEPNIEQEPPRPPVINEAEWQKLPKSQAKSVFDLYQLYAKDIDPSDVVMIKGIIDMMQMKYKDKESDDSTVG